MSTSPLPISLRRADPQSGIVLPVVLVMLLLMTITVLFLMRRGTVDELLASNVRQVTTLDTAAQFALRTCERLLWVAPPGVAPESGAPNPPPTVPAPAANETAAWQVNANWAVDGAGVCTVTNGRGCLSLPAADYGPGVLAARCLVEDAGNELEILKDNVRNDANGLSLDNTWRKYRITVEVIGNNNTFGRAQAEVRMNVIGS